MEPLNFDNNFNSKETYYFLTITDPKIVTSCLIKTFWDKIYNFLFAGAQQVSFISYYFKLFLKALYLGDVVYKFKNFYIYEFFFFLNFSFR